MNIMKALDLNEYVSFEKLNQWLNTLDFTKEEPAMALEEALNAGFEDGCINIPYSYVRRNDPTIKMTVEERRVDDHHVEYRVSEGYSSVINLILNKESMQCVIVQSYGHYPSFVFLIEPEYAILWEDFKKGR